MNHRIWILTNIALITISIIYIWVFRPHQGSYIVAGQLLAQIAIILFIMNINMYFIFLVIRKTSIRKVKIRLAKFSRYLMKWHISIAVFGTTIIIGHAAINLKEMGRLVGFTHLKLVSGYFALSFLCLTLFAGYLRHKKASGFRRKFHLISAMSFLAVFLFHMFVLV